MVFVPNEKLKRKMSKDGSVLKYMHSVAGAGLGLMAAGGMIVAIGLLLAAALADPLGTEGAVKVCAVTAVPGILLVIAGVFLQKKRMDKWLKTYVKKTGLTVQELQQVDDEFKRPGTVLLSLEKGKDSNSLKKMGFITAHYVKLPGVSPYIFRLQDMVACFYTEQFPSQSSRYDNALVAYSTDQTRAYIAINADEKACLEIVDAVEAHNPMVITTHRFLYEDKEYDAVRGMEEVIKLHRQVHGGQ